MSEVRRRERPDGPAARSLPGLALAAVLLAAIFLFGSMGARRAAEPDQSPPEEAPPEISIRTTQVQVPWDRAADLRRVTLDAPGLPVEVWLEHPVFLPEGEGYEAINAFFRQMCDDYFSPENEALVRAMEAASADGTQFTWTNTAALEFSGVGIAVTLDRGGEEERYLFRADTGELVDPSDADGEEFTGLPWVPEPEYRVTVTDDGEAGVRRAVLDTQGLDLNVCFETPLLEGDGPGEQAIGRFFEDLRGDFFSPSNKGLAQAWEYAAYPDAPPGTYFYERRALTHCQTEKLVSVSIDYEWYLGGVVDYGSDSYTFRADTGARLTLAQLAAEGERELKAMILAAAEEQDGGTGAIDLDRLERYALDDFEFYVEDGSIFISFDKYELTDGAYGGFTLEIPASIREGYR